MKAANFLFIAGGCFILAAVFRYFHNLPIATALYVPGVIFLVIGAVFMIHSFWTSRHGKPS